MKITPTRLLANLSTRFTNLNRKLTILSHSIPGIADWGSSKVSRDGDIGLSPSFSNFLSQVDSNADISKAYNEWKQDLLIEYFRPRK